jgi:hypothetical protein
MKPDSNPPLSSFKKGRRLLRDLKKPLFEQEGGKGKFIQRTADTPH